MSGPRAALPRDVDGSEDLYRGERLGLPEHGPGSVAGTGRRVLAFVVDIATAALVAWAFTAPSAPGSWGLLVWVLVGVVAVTVVASTPGQLLLGLHVVRVDAAVPVGPVRAVGRVALTFLIVPVVVTDLDGRGLQDRATSTAVVRSR